MTESRLNDLCRRFANRPPKRLIFDRLLREAKRMLLFSACTVHETAYSLGFAIRPISPVFQSAGRLFPSTYRAAQHALS